jgi:hypothetical protein
MAFVGFLCAHASTPELMTHMLADGLHVVQRTSEIYVRISNPSFQFDFINDKASELLNVIACHPEISAALLPLFRLHSFLHRRLW